MNTNHPISFWQAIIEAEYAVPEGYTAVALTPELLLALGATAPVLRDEIALSILAEWLAKPDYYTPDELRAIAAHMGENLRVGIGETGSDTVFLRSFSALVLDCVIDYDNNHPFLREAEVFMMLDQSIVYLRDERDLRGYVAEKGWAHATAHTADLLTYLVRSPHLRQAELERVFQGIATRVTQPVEHVYLYREDERLAVTVMAALHRDILAIDFLENWCEQLAHPVGEVLWFRATTEFPSACAYQNTVQFVRSLYFQLLFGTRAPAFFADDQYYQQPPAVRDGLLPRLERTIRALAGGFYPQENADDAA